MLKNISAMILIAAMFVAQKPAVHANCCLCMCHTKDETKCSQMCIRLQHGKKIVEEPEMIRCTAACKRKGMKTI